MELGFTVSRRLCQPSRKRAMVSAGDSKSAAGKSARRAPRMGGTLGRPLWERARRVEHERPLGETLGESAAARENDATLHRHFSGDRLDRGDPVVEGALRI